MNLAFKWRCQYPVRFSNLRCLLTRSVSTVQRSHAVQAFNDIPGPLGLPWLGSFHHYILGGGVEKMLIQEQKFYREYGPIFKENLLGRTFVHVMDPDEIEKLFRSEGPFPIRGPVADSWMTYRKRRQHSLGVFLSDGKEWKRYRQALAPKMLRPRELEANVSHLNEVARDALDNMAAKRECGGTDEGEIPDLEGELLRWTAESIGSLMFDARLGLYKDPVPDEAVRFTQAVHDFFANFYKLEVGVDRMFYKVMDTPAWIKFSRAADTFMEIGQTFVDRKLNEIKEDIDKDNLKSNSAVPILTYLLSKKELSLHEVYVTATEPFMAGVDTTSFTMLWLMYELAKNKHAQERLRDEVLQVLGSEEDATPKTIKELRYMKACLKESLRLNPLIFAIPRVLSQDTVLSGYSVPAGTIVLISVYTSGRSEEHFEDPLEFKPERWLRGNKEKHHPFSSLPFGFGARMCLGRRIAELEIYVLLTKIVQRFKLEYHHESIQPILQALTVPDRPVRLKFLDRN